MLSTRQWRVLYWYLCLLQNPLIPRNKREDLISHIVLVHQSIGVYSKRFQQQLRRNNYVTPKNYLDYINTYIRLLEQKDQFIQSLVRISCLTSVFFVPG